MQIPSQELLTRDNVTIHVDGLAFFRVVDAFKALCNVLRTVMRLLVRLLSDTFEYKHLVEGELAGQDPRPVWVIRSSSRDAGPTISALT